MHFHFFFSFLPLNTRLIHLRLCLNFDLGFFPRFCRRSYSFFQQMPIYFPPFITAGLLFILFLVGAPPPYRQILLLFSRDPVPPAFFGCFPSCELITRLPLLVVFSVEGSGEDCLYQFVFVLFRNFSSDGLNASLTVGPPPSLFLFTRVKGLSAVQFVFEVTRSGCLGCFFLPLSPFCYPHVFRI